MGGNVLDVVHVAVKRVVERPVWRGMSPLLRLRRFANPVSEFDVSDSVRSDLIGSPAYPLRTLR
jgi:hypothetical protein